MSKWLIEVTPNWQTSLTVRYGIESFSISGSVTTLDDSRHNLKTAAITKQHI